MTGGHGVTREKGKVILWPHYFDEEYTRRGGRRLPSNMALKNVKSDEILQAAKDLGLDPELRPDVAHPRHPWDRRGAVLVGKRQSKSDLIEEIAKRMRQKRTSK